MRSVLYVICAIGVLACAGTVPSGAHAAFPGGNGKIAFVSSGEIYTMNPDGSAQTDISNNAASDLPPPGRLRHTNRLREQQGRQLRDLQDERGRIGTDPAHEQRPPRILFRPGRATGESSSSVAAAAAGARPAGEIYIMNADGSGETNITNNAATDCAPSGSVSGSNRLFSSDRDGAGFELYTMNPDGSGGDPDHEQRGFDDYADWSPDAARMRSSSDLLTTTSGVMQADGSGRTQLTDTPNRFEFFPGVVATGKTRSFFDAVLMVRLARST